MQPDTFADMIPDPAATDEDQSDRRTVSMVLRTFSAPATEPRQPPVITREHVVEIAHAWQQIGVFADWFEIHGANLGLGRDRLHELAGCVAAAGEQLGLAWTSEQDSERWRAGKTGGTRMAVRALADIRSLFALGAAHGMGNATLRTLFLEPAVRAALQKVDKDLKQYPAFSNDRGAWRTFNNRLVHALEAGAISSNQAPVVDLVTVLRALLDDARYKALDERRGMDFHRWRPQSLPVGSGVPIESLWEVSAGAQSIGIGGSFPADPLADPDAAATIATEGLDAIAEAMRLWLERWPSALEALGVELLEVS